MRSGSWLLKVNRLAQAGVLLLVAALALVAGVYIKQVNRVSSVADGAARQLMLASLYDPDGKSQALSQWRGKVLVVNFWATWCAPCREEIPALMRAQRKYAANGIQIVGIALDNASKVREYAAEMHVDYALLIGGMETVALSKDLGNGAGVLPFTVVLDRSGKLAYVHAGALTDSILATILPPLL